MGRKYLHTITKTSVDSYRPRYLFVVRKPSEYYSGITVAGSRELGEVAAGEQTFQDSLTHRLCRQYTSSIWQGDAAVLEKKRKLRDCRASSPAGHRTRVSLQRIAIFCTCRQCPYAANDAEALPDQGASIDGDGARSLLNPAPGNTAFPFACAPRPRAIGGLYLARCHHTPCTTSANIASNCERCVHRKYDRIGFGTFCVESCRSISGICLEA